MVQVKSNETYIYSQEKNYASLFVRNMVENMMKNV